MTHEALTEYEAITRPGGVGLIDRPGFAVLQLIGDDRRTFLQGMVSNDVAALAPGQGCRAAFLDPTGHVQAYLRVHALPDALLLETDPRAAPKLAETLDKFLIMEDVEIADVSGDWAYLSVLGEGARDALSTLLPTPLPDDLPPLGHVPVALPDGTGGFAVNAPLGPVPGFDLWLPIASAPAVRGQVLATGVTPLSEETTEILRVEAGQPAWGRELDESVLLPEADQPDAVSYTKGCYVGQEIVARIQARGHTNRALRGVLLGHDAPVPPPNATLHAPQNGPEPGREIGRVTSAVESPRFDGRPLALAYVRREYFADGTPIDVQIAQPDGTMFAYHGTVLARPFHASQG